MSLSLFWRITKCLYLQLEDDSKCYSFSKRLPILPFIWVYRTELPDHHGNWFESRLSSEQAQTTQFLPCCRNVLVTCTIIIRAEKTVTACFIFLIKIPRFLGRVKYFFNTEYLLKWPSYFPPELYLLRCCTLNALCYDS